MDDSTTSTGNRIYESFEDYLDDLEHPAELDFDDDSDTQAEDHDDES